MNKLDRADRRQILELGQRAIECGRDGKTVEELEAELDYPREDLELGFREMWTAAYSAGRCDRTLEQYLKNKRDSGGLYG